MHWAVLKMLVISTSSARRRAICAEMHSGRSIPATQLPRNADMTPTTQTISRCVSRISTIIARWTALHYLCWSTLRWPAVIIRGGAFRHWLAFQYGHNLHIRWVLREIRQWRCWQLQTLSKNNTRGNFHTFPAGDAAWPGILMLAEA